MDQSEVHQYRFCIRLLALLGSSKNTLKAVAAIRSLLWKCLLFYGGVRDTHTECILAIACSWLLPAETVEERLRLDPAPTQIFQWRRSVCKELDTVGRRPGTGKSSSSDLRSCAGCVVPACGMESFQEGTPPPELTDSSVLLNSEAVLVFSFLLRTLYSFPPSHPSCLRSTQHTIKKFPFLSTPLSGLRSI